MLKAVLRGVFALITLPIVLGIYWLLFAVLIGFGADFGGNFESNLWSLGFAWVAVLVAYPLIDRFVIRKVL